MKKKKIFQKRFFLFLLLNFFVFFAILISSCSKPTLSFVDGAELKSKEGDSLLISIRVVIKNKNIFSISGKNVSVFATNAGDSVVFGKIDKFSVGAFSSDTINVLMIMSAKNIIKLYQNSGDNISTLVNINGSFSPLFFLKSFSVESTIEKKLINDLMMKTFLAGNNIHFDSFRYSPVSFTQSELKFNIHLKNSINLSYTLLNLDVEVTPKKGSETIIGNWKLAKKVTLDPLKENTLEGSFKVNHMSLMLAGLEKGMSDLNSVFIKGNASVLIDKSILNIPFAYPIEVDMKHFKIKNPM